LFHSRRSAISGQLGKLAGSGRSSSDIERGDRELLRDRLPTNARDEYHSHDANWEDYQDLLELLGEANGPLISDNEVELQVLTQLDFVQFVMQAQAPASQIGQSRRHFSMS